MKTIRLENFRSLTNTNDVEIKPITLLLGQNSSGKSTFLRSFALLKQGITVRARGPFLWVGELVDFGGVSETISTFSEERKLSLTYKFDLPGSLAILRKTIGRSTDVTEVSVSISELEISEKTDISFAYNIDIDKDNFSFSLTREGDFSWFSINGIDYTGLMTQISANHWKGPIPTFANKGANDALKKIEDEDSPDNFESTLRDFVNSHVHGRTGEQKRDILIDRIIRFPRALLQVVKLGGTGDTSWRKHVKDWTSRSAEFKNLKGLVLGCRFLDYMNLISEYTVGVLERSKYITPLRASAERYYRKQGLAVDELDARGSNFSQFLNNMTPLEQFKFSEWSQKFFGVSISVEEQGGHLSIFITSKENPSAKVNITDTGFGFSQMFPILAQLWVAQDGAQQDSAINIPILFSIEQPELHLHPRLQANLADVLVSSINAANEAGIDLRLIIETHSEYLVNRLGYLISKKEIPSTLASILIFDRSSYLEPTQIIRANYSERGFLENWPHGFFEPISL